LPAPAAVPPIVTPSVPIPAATVFTSMPYWLSIAELPSSEVPIRLPWIRTPVGAPPELLIEMPLLLWEMRLPAPATVPPMRASADPDWK
jgi:hypothetical protein